MKEIWKKEFSASYIRQDEVIVLNDKDIPLPESFINNPKLRSNVIFPPETRAGDHYHNEREEVFVGFGEGMELLVEDPKSKKIETFKMDPSKNSGRCVVFYMTAGLPHAVRNIGSGSGFLIEFASFPQEKVDYKIPI